MQRPGSPSRAARESILNKRAGYRAAFDNFDAQKIARYTPARVEKLLANPDIVRNRLKVNAIISNAKAYLPLHAQPGGFDRYLWQFTGGRTIVNHWRSLKEVPARTPEAEAMSKDLLKRGFKFVGPTICYAFMQAVGMVDDHTTDCYRRAARKSAPSMNDVAKLHDPRPGRGSCNFALHLCTGPRGCAHPPR